jgi:hypothetical protein
LAVFIFVMLIIPLVMRFSGIFMICNGMFQGTFHLSSGGSSFHTIIYDLILDWNYRDISTFAVTFETVMYNPKA